MLRQNLPGEVTWTQRQTACLMANLFFCTFPPRNSGGKSVLPSIDFASLYRCQERGQPSPVQLEKLRCVLHYFGRAAAYCAPGGDWHDNTNNNNNGGGGGKRSNKTGAGSGGDKEPWCNSLSKSLLFIP